MINTKLLELRLYSFFWETFNKCRSVTSFKDTIDEKFATATEEERIFLISAATRFFNFHNISLLDPERNVLSKIRIADYGNNGIVTLLSKHLKLIKELFVTDSNDGNIKYIKEEDFDYAMNSLNSLPINPQEKKQLIKNAIIKAFKLTKDHKIIFEENQIVVKLEIVKSAQQLDLEHIYGKENEHYYEKLMKDVSFQVIKGILDPASIDNLYFHKSYKTIYISQIKSTLEQSYTSNPLLLEPFCVFLFKQYKEDLLLLFADKLLLLVEEKNPNVLKFINFYNGSSTIIDGQTITKPSIKIGEENWSYNKMASFLKSRHSFREKNRLDSVERGDYLLDRMKKTLDELKKKRDGFSEEEKSGKKYQDILFDIDITEKDLLRREQKHKDEQEGGSEIKQEYDKMNETRENIKRAIVQALEGVEL